LAQPGVDQRTTDCLPFARLQGARYIFGKLARRRDWKYKRDYREATNDICINSTVSFYSLAEPEQHCVVKLSNALTILLLSTDDSESDVSFIK